MSTTPTPYDDAKAQLKRAQEILGFSDDDYALLATPRREITVAVPVKRDDGTETVLQGYRIQHNWTRGPGKEACATPRMLTWKKSERSRCS